MCAVSHLAPLNNACPRVYLKIILTKHEKQFQIAFVLRQSNVSCERGQKADIFTTNAPVKIHQMALFYFSMSLLAVGSIKCFSWNIWLPLSDAPLTFSRN